MSLSPDFTCYLILHTGIFPEVDTNFETHFYSFVRLFFSSVSYPAFGIPGKSKFRFHISGSRFPHLELGQEKRAGKDSLRLHSMLHEIRWIRAT